MFLVNITQIRLRVAGHHRHFYLLAIATCFALSVQDAYLPCHSDA